MTEHTEAQPLLNPGPTGPAAPWDSIVIGGGAAGLSAALMLGRARRRVLVVDAGEPRNRFAAHMHGALGHDGLDPAELLRRGREEVRGYGVEVREGSATGVFDDDDPTSPGTLTVRFTGDWEASARSIVVASGQTDQLPDLPGLREQWGVGVLHCPYCHGWQVRGKRLAVLGSTPMSVHQAQLVRQWSDDLVFLTAGAGELDHGTAARLRSRGVRLEPTPVAGILSHGGPLTGVRLEDDRVLHIDAVFVASTGQPHLDFLGGLGLETTEGPMGSYLVTDQFGQTSHPRVWAVGNVANPGATVPVSMAAGSMAGGMVNMALVNEEFDTATTAAAAPAPAPSPVAAHWEGEYAGDHKRWSGAVNATTAAVIGQLPPGDALDLGCGEGGDAVWLAEQGWHVTAVDISPTALTRGAQAAAERGVAGRIDWVSADLATWSTDQPVDLVTASFLHSEVELPRTDILRRAAERVRPGGHLLVVSHVFESEADIPPWARAAEHQQEADETGPSAHTHGAGAHPGHTLPSPAEQLEALAPDPREWEIVLDEIRQREAVGPDGVQRALLKDGVLLLRRR